MHPGALWHLDSGCSAAVLLSNRAGGSACLWCGLMRSAASSSPNSTSPPLAPAQGGVACGDSIHTKPGLQPAKGARRVQLAALPKHNLAAAGACNVHTGVAWRGRHQRNDLRCCIILTPRAGAADRRGIHTSCGATVQTQGNAIRAADAPSQPSPALLPHPPKSSNGPPSFLLSPSAPAGSSAARRAKKPSTAERCAPASGGRAPEASAAATAASPSARGEGAPEGSRVQAEHRLDGIGAAVVHRRHLAPGKEG